MYQYPPQMQMIILKQHEEDLIRDIKRFPSVKLTSSRSSSWASGIVQFLSEKVFRTHSAEEVCAEC